MSLEDAAHNRTLSERIEADLRARLTSGRLALHERFPSESAVAEEFGVTRMTARKAILNLIDSGLLYRLTGKGTFVADPNIVRQVRPRVQTKTIAMLVPGLELSMYNQVIEAVLSAMETQGYDVVLRATNRDPISERHNFETLDSEKFEGAIVLGVLSMQSNADALRGLCARMPVVAVDEPPAELDVDFVYNDDVRGAYMATSHLIELGHKRVAHLAAVEDRLQGYKEALDRYSLEYDEEIVRWTHWKMSEGYSEATKLLLNHKDITAIFAANDILAVGAYQALVSLGLRVPDDVALVGYGDLDLSALLGVKLSTVNQNPRTMGGRAAALLLEKLSGARDAHDSRSVVVPIRMVTRESCGIYSPRRR